MCVHVTDGAGGGKSCCGVLADRVIRDIQTDMYGAFQHM